MSEPDVLYSEHGIDGKPHKVFVEVSVATTSGFYPHVGSTQVPAHQHVSVFLATAARALHLVDTHNWTATVTGQTGRRELSVASSFLDNHLHGVVEIEWGPREGAGGMRADGTVAGAF